MKLILAILFAITAAILVRRWLDWDKPIADEYPVQVDPWVWRNEPTVTRFVH